MSPKEIANESANLIVQGIAVTDNPAGFWLELFNLYAGFCEAHIGPDAAKQVIATLKSAEVH